MKNPNQEARKGDILWGDNNINQKGISPHNIVFLEPYEDGTLHFIGAMLTHSMKKEFGNIPMQKGHFVEKDSMGKIYKVTFDNSLVVSKKFFKKVEWAPFTKVGELTPDGIKFVEQHIGKLAPEFFPFNM